MIVDYSDDEDLFTDYEAPTIVKESKKVDNDIREKILNNVKKIKRERLKKIEDITSDNKLNQIKKDLEELSNETIVISNNAKPVQEVAKATSDFPKPKSGFRVRCIDLLDNLIQGNQGSEEDSITTPDNFNLNLIVEDQHELIPKENLAKKGLLTTSERKRHNLDTFESDNGNVITAKKVCMDNLVPERPLEIPSGLSSEDLSQFRNKKGDEPDRNASRQHQITWLQHKAKEREFELQNNWAASCDAKSDRRKKYGF